MAEFLAYHFAMNRSRSGRAVALVAVLVLGLEVVGTQTQPAPDVAGVWRLVSTSVPPNTAPKLTVTGPSPNGMLKIERGYATELVTDVHRVDLPPLGAESEAKRVGNTIVLVLPGQISRGAAPSTPNREEVWSVNDANELTIDVTDRFGNGPPARSRLTYRRESPSARPGENLVANPDASRGRADWTFFGDANVEGRDGDPCFVIRNHGTIDQTVFLPDGAAGRYLVAIGSGASERVDATITGKPYLYGMIQIASGRIVGAIQGQKLRGESPVANTWVTMSGVFLLPDGAVRIGFQLRQAENRNFPQNGSAARFDDLGLYLFPSEAEARGFVNRWKGRAGSQSHD
jgi:hypothetical protein